MTPDKSARLTIVLPHTVDARLRELAQQQGRILREALRDGGR